MDYFAQVMLDLVEFANGDVTTTWGKVRADMGHPKPFNLKMMGIGNENWGPEFWERVEPICRIVRARHPEIKIIGSVGAAPAGISITVASSPWSREGNGVVTPCPKSVT